MGALAAACLVAGLELAGQTSCPAPGAVVAALARIDPALASGEVITLEPGPRAGAVIRFRSRAGVLLAERPLPPAFSCAERADAAAVIIAARLQAAPAAPRIEPLGLLAARAPTPRPLELEAAAIVTRAGASFAPGVRAGLALGAKHLVRLSLGHVARHDTPIGAGAATWSRTALGLAYARRLRPAARPALFAEAGLGLVASLTSVAGVGIATTAGARVFHPGAGAELRAGADRGSLRASIGLGVEVWLRSQEFYLRNGPSALAPRWQLTAALTLGWHRAPK